MKTSKVLTKKSLEICHWSESDFQQVDMCPNSIGLIISLSLIECRIALPWKRKRKERKLITQQQLIFRKLVLISWLAHWIESKILDFNHQLILKVAIIKPYLWFAFNPTLASSLCLTKRQHVLQFISSKEYVFRTKKISQLHHLTEDRYIKIKLLLIVLAKILFIE